MRYRRMRVEAALQAAEQVDRAAVERRRAVEGELEEAEYEASLAARRYELVDPAKRHVARELEARWNTRRWSASSRSSNVSSGWTPSGRRVPRSIGKH